MSVGWCNDAVPTGRKYDHQNPDSEQQGSSTNHVMPSSYWLVWQNRRQWRVYCKRPVASRSSGSVVPEWRIGVPESSHARTSAVQSTPPVVFTHKLHSVHTGPHGTPTVPTKAKQG